MLPIIIIWQYVSTEQNHPMLSTLAFTVKTESPVSVFDDIYINKDLLLEYILFKLSSCANVYVVLYRIFVHFFFVYS